MGLIPPARAKAWAGRSRIIFDGFSIRNCGNKQGGAFTFRFIQGQRVNLVFPNGSDASKCQDFACLKTPIFRRCYFYNNIASSMGGALFIKDGRPVFEDCIFFSNSANTGGAVYVRLVAELKLFEAIFSCA